MSLADPKPISLPKPSPLAVISAKWQRALADPNGASMPICSFVKAPISYISMTAPTVAPNVIGSIPSSLQTILANCNASKSLTPLAAPSAQAASYSNPPDALMYWGLFCIEKCVSSIFEIRPQAIVQPKHA